MTLPLNPSVQMPPGLGVRRWSLRNRRFRVQVPGRVPNWRVSSEVADAKAVTAFHCVTALQDAVAPKSGSWTQLSVEVGNPPYDAVGRTVLGEPAKSVRNYSSLGSPGTVRPTGKPRHGALRRWAGWLLLFCVYFLFALPAPAQISKEYQVKAVCLWRLAQFVTWPTNVFENANSPIVIAILGENPFGDLLKAAVSGETAHGRKLVVQHHRSVSDIKSCHILFVSASEARQTNKVFAELAGRSILTVADFEDFARSKGGLVCFVTRQNKVKLQINLKAVTAARLGLDPRLLRAAEVIDDK